MEIEGSCRRCEQVVDRIKSLPLSRVTDCCKNTLLRLVKSELNFLSRLSLSPRPFSCNIGYIEAIVHLLQQPYITKVSRVCKSISLSLGASIHIDIVCSLNNSPAWFLVSDRNPKYITWDTNQTNKGFKFRIQQILDAAQYSHPLNPAFIFLFFANGLETPLLNKLEMDFGFKLFNLDFSHFQDECTHVVAKPYRGASTLVLDIHQSLNSCPGTDYVIKLLSTHSHHKELSETSTQLASGFSFQSLILRMKEWLCEMKYSEDLFEDDDLLNFDTTALIALISGISNGAAENLLRTPENELRQQFKSNTDFVISQAKSEIERPILDELSCFLSGRKGIVCKNVHSEFMDIVSMCGGHNEKMRANQLMKLLKIVPDNPSMRMMSLPTTRKLALKNKVAFGTGDYYGAPTLTANMGFVRAISQTGMPLFTIEHRSRALIGE